MPRSPRRELADGLHHVTARSPSGRLLFHTDADRLGYLALLEAEVVLRGWSVLTYCLMTNHLHLLVRTPAPDLGDGIKCVHERYAGGFNRHRAEHGHLFGDRFHNTLVQSDRHAIACLRYIARNPVEAGLCPSPAGWRWSAHRALVGMEPAPRFLDVAALGEALGANSIREYELLTAQSDPRLLRTLAATGKEDWMATAVDDFGIPVEDVASQLGIHASTAYRRLDAARAYAKKGTVP
jgi:REP element-mobilizing transposase RayT